MSDQQAGHANLHFLIERAHAKCLGGKIFQGYFDTCSAQPYYSLLQNYKTDLESKGEKPTFPDFLESSADALYKRALTILSNENQAKAEEEQLSQKNLERMAKTRVNAWKEQYQYYEHEKIIQYQENDDSVREGSIDANSILPFEEFAQSCQGELFGCLFGPYTTSLQDTGDIPTLTGLLKYCYDQGIIDSQGNKSVFADRSRNYGERFTDIVLDTNSFKTDGQSDTMAVREFANDTVRFLSEGLYVYRLAENGTLQNREVAKLFRETFHHACNLRHLLIDEEQEVGLGNFKPDKLENPTALLLDLVECRASAAAVIYKYLGDVSLIRSYAGSEAVEVARREVETKCHRGTEAICCELIELCQTKTELNRNANHNALYGNTLSEKVLSQLRRFTSITPAAPSGSPSSSGGGSYEGVLQARFGGGTEY